jgi:oxaloacetate decarboxylase (Na+ extruding) subunit alpha
MTTGMILPIASRVACAGFDAVEILSPSFLGKCVRELREDPFERIRLVARQMPSTRLRANAGGLNLFGFEESAMYQLFWELMSNAGIRETRISDAWNDPAMRAFRAGAARRAGVDPIINITYSISPRHTDAYFAERVRAAVALDPYRICLKDPGGLLTPDRVRTLVPTMLANSRGIPIEMHSHCTTGMGPLCTLEAVKLAIRIVNVAIPPLADDASLPSVFNIAKNLRALGYEVMIDEEALQQVAKHFEVVARREALPVGVRAEFDHAQYVRQVPGGMISNLEHQLREVGAEDRLPVVLEETVTVRADFGYPIMVTPLSQFVGSQAAINVIVGERYERVTDQVIRYALGHYGEEAVTLMDENVRGKILDRPRAREIIAAQRTPQTIEELRREFGGPGVSDEDFLLRWLLRKEDVDAMRAAGPVQEYVTEGDPLVSLVKELVALTKYDRIIISRPGFRLGLSKTPQ